MDQEKFESYLQTIIDELSPQAIALCQRLPVGKRLRSRLICTIAGQDDQAQLLCAVVELIHAASLLHDDVLDDAMTRRGQESINARFGDKTAIMLGDILYSHAFSKLPKLGEKIATIIARAVVRLSEGEMADVALSESFNENEALYMEMIDNKTAALIEASAQCAALISGYDDEDFRQYGRILGLAFQIVDDLLDITQDAATLGKPSMNDLAEGKTTLPFQYLYRALSDDEKNSFIAMFKQPPCEKTRLWIDERMVRYGIYDAIKQKIALLSQEAQEAVMRTQAPLEVKEALLGMITAMTKRVF